jgi:hypothetical protein
VGIGWAGLPAHAFNAPSHAMSEIGLNAWAA